MKRKRVESLLTVFCVVVGMACVPVGRWLKGLESIPSERSHELLGTVILIICAGLLAGVFKSLWCMKP